MTPDELDRALIEAAAVGLFAERAGGPLLPWQQRVVDQAVATPGPVTLARPRRRSA